MHSLYSSLDGQIEDELKTHWEISCVWGIIVDELLYCDLGEVSKYTEEVGIPAGIQTGTCWYTIYLSRWFIHIYALVTKDIKNQSKF